MPELPEVETIRRTLKPQILHRRIKTVRVHYLRSLQNTGIEELKQALTGHCFTDLERRGKYLIASLDSEEKLILHLRMTGRLTVVPAAAPVEKHTTLQITFRDGEELRLVDQRRFALIYLVIEKEEGCIQGLAQMGPEPLQEDFTPAYLLHIFRRRSARVKSLLLNQRYIGGLGNIYADESLHRAGIHPQRPANSLDAAEIDRLHRAIETVIREGIAYRGTTVRDYVDGDGRTGNYQERLQVYGREGLPCPTCQTPIRRVKVGGRSSFYCPKCQK